MITTGIALALIAAFTIGIEGRLRRTGDARSWQTTESDRGSQLAVSIAFAVTILLLMAATLLTLAGIGRMPDEPLVGTIGLALMVAGMAIRYAAVRTLGAFYTRTLRVSEAHELVDTGPYRFVRHPGYAGTILLLGGAALATANWFAVAVGPIVVVAMYLYRIRAEEAMLRRELGEAYSAYAARTRRLIPFVF
jgi:protein-S-isoprenylcysteine O-methyltransferase Ste14